LTKTTAKSLLIKISKIS